MLFPSPPPGGPPLVRSRRAAPVALLTLTLALAAATGVTSCDRRRDRPPAPSPGAPGERPPAAPVAGPPRTSADLLDRIVRLDASESFHEGLVARVTGVELVPHGSADPNARVHATRRAEPPYESVELRRPVAQGDRPTGFIVLHLTGSPCVVEADAVARLGTPDADGTAGVPVGSPFRTWTRSWGVLGLRFAPESKGCLRTAVLDGLQP